jgi:hypothetical protein
MAKDMKPNESFAYAVDVPQPGQAFAVRVSRRGGARPLFDSSGLRWAGRAIPSPTWETIPNCTFSTSGGRRRVTI